MHIQFPCFTPRELNEFNYQNNSSEKLSNTHTQQQNLQIHDIFKRSTKLEKRYTHNRKRNYSFEEVCGM